MFRKKIAAIEFGRGGSVAVQPIGLFIHIADAVAGGIR